MITAGIASIPHREENLKQTVESLANQVDKINVYLDNYPHVPAYLTAPKVEVIRSQDFPGLGDAGKFFWVHNCKGYYLSCDDDLIYPPDYVEKTIEKIEQYDRMCVVSYHGRTLHSPIKSYYSKNDTREKYPCLNPLGEDKFVQFGGTGVMGFHTDTIKVHVKDFKEANMADIWLALLAQRQQVPILVAEHLGGWIYHQVIYGGTIYSTYARHDKTQTKVVNDYKDWTIFVYKPLVA